MNKIYRLLFFALSVLVPIVFGWWLFLPFALLSVYLIKTPYELIITGAVLDSVYYFGEGFLGNYRLTLGTLILIIAALFLNGKIHWQKRI
jgi:uncharacterized RDD family membrane protein YckC